LLIEHVDVHSFAGLPWEGVYQELRVHFQRLATSLGDKEGRIDDFDVHLVKQSAMGYRQRVCEVDLQDHASRGPLLDEDIKAEQLRVFVAQQAQLEVRDVSCDVELIQCNLAWP
jgi:hypothetical protein